VAKFHYPFQKILDLKENEKEFAQIQMAEAIKQQEASLQKNQVIYEKIVEAETLIKQKQQEGINIFELRMLEDYLIQLKEQLIFAQRELKQMESHVVRTQSDLRVKVQEEKTWINIKNQKQSQFDEQVRLSEQSFFDEMATTRFYRVISAERG